MTEQEETVAVVTVKNKRGRKKGYHHSIETRLKMANSHIGHQPSEETIEKISEARKGFHHTEESRRKMSETRKKNFLLKKAAQEAAHAV